MACQSGSNEVAKPPTEAVGKDKPISTIVIIIAMQAEALPIVQRFKLSEDSDFLFPKGVPWVRYHGLYKDLYVNLIWPGKDSYLGVDSIGTVSASLVTYASIQALHPDLIINAGTAGGFKAKGACIADVFMPSDVAFHARRRPLPPWDPLILSSLCCGKGYMVYYQLALTLQSAGSHPCDQLAYHSGIGARPTFSTPNLLNELNLKVGKLSTGDSLVMSPWDEEVIMKNMATIKDMEGAAVAYVADLLSVPIIFIKAVIDIVDGDKPSAEELLQNLTLVTEVLGETVSKVVDFISGKRLSQL